ncbi:MAG TPA: amino acid adenylation domain-containing protein [Pyrinomonadaceae bacterium]|nr:amino acid adenylation domain-containing protein [Pyrinomonadaceae bacterium]
MQPVIEGFRLSPQQRRLWKLQQATSHGASAFVSQLVLLLEGELRPEVLRDALEKVCTRHESLRTVFRRLPGVAMPVQVVQDQTLISWQATDLDYENGPLMHAMLTTLAPDRYLFSITMPALCADRRTLSNFASELFGSAESDEERLQYVQFSEWQNSLSEEEDAEKGRTYWAQQNLANVSAVLPAQRTRQRARTEIPRELEAVKLHSTPEYAARIDALAKKHDTTSATLFLAAWQTLLWRLTQQPVVIGNVTEGRSYELLQDGFGLFARVLPVCCQFTDDLRFSEVSSEIDRFQRESEEWQDYFSLDEAAKNSPGYFAFGFEYSQIPSPWQAGELRISVDRQNSFAEPFDLKLTAVLKADAIEAAFEYNSAVFDEPYVKLIAEQFQTLLDSALANPESPIAELEIVSAAQRQQIVVEWNQTNRDYDLTSCVHELFEQQVERTPDALAAVFQNEQLSFAELNHRANQLAAYLKAEGAGVETAIGIRIEPSLEMLIAVLGILKTGGAYVPLDPRNPQQRIDQVLQDAGASILLTREVVTKALSQSTNNRESHLSADNLAYIIYTSGSTGQPKGVMIQHRSVANLAAALHEQVYVSLGPSLKVGLSAPLAFDASVKQLVQLLHGHTLHILPEELRLDAMGALNYIDQHQLDVLDCTPSQLKLLLAAGLTHSNAPKLMLVGGEAIDESTWARLAEDRRTRFFNVYGPTECTVDATWASVAADQPIIGNPIPNARTYILDKNLKPTGVHLSGELFIGGTGLARGYLNSPERTAERFIPDDLSGAEGARLYRTGDLARYAADGSIVFTGRNDAQVKVRGHRIELGEIESVLLRSDKIKQAVVVACEAANADVRLVAYVVTVDNSTLDTSEMRQKLSGQLPDYMVPSFLVALDELPLTRNGKVDLNALPAPETAQRSRDENYVAPRNEIEATITRVWQEALGVERIGVNDNFFDAGGHSLLMVQVHNKLSDLFDKKISIVEMFAKPTISALAEYFSETNGHKPTFERVMDRAARRRQAVSMRQ